MARAFIASVPLAIVLVAALVVPLTVIPGTFGFQSWPKSLDGKVSERQIQVAPAPVPSTVAVTKPTSRPAAGTRRDSAAPSPGRDHATRASVKPAPAPTHNLRGHRSTAVETPHGAGPGRTHGNDPATPNPAPSTPSAPAEQPTPAPAPVPTPDTVASEAPPIAREDPAANPAPTPPPPPVVEVVPQQPPPPPAEEPSDEPEGPGHGHGRGLALGHLLGHGHGNGHREDRD